MRRHALLALVALAVIVQARAADARRPRPPAVLYAAGDIADCSSNGAALTAGLIKGHPGLVAAIGDTAYPTGSASDYQRCYSPTWGQFRSRTRPAPGNHEYLTENASGYFAYFGKRAAAPGGYYSYNLGGWHIVVVNSECGEIGGCGPGSPQLGWLEADLARHPARCTLAYWHRPRFSSGPHGPSEEMQPIWATLVGADAEIVLSGHDHLYQRFAPLNAAGRVDRARGVREFVVGTGGGPLYPAVRPSVGSRRIVVGHWGVLRLELGAKHYRWQFISAINGTVIDSGSGSCH